MTRRRGRSAGRGVSGCRRTAGRFGRTARADVAIDASHPYWEVHVYTFGTTSVSNFVWLNNGALFSNVVQVEVEAITAGGFRLEVVSPAGKLLSYGWRVNGQGGWHVFDFNVNMKSLVGQTPPYLSPYISPYKLRLVNFSPNRLFFKHGAVTT